MTKNEFFKKNHLNVIQYIGIAMSAVGIFDIVFLGAFGIIPIIIGTTIYLSTDFFGSQAYKRYLDAKQ